MMPGYTLGWKQQAALIGAKSTIELAAIADVGVGLAGVVGPHNTEGEHTLGLNHTAQQVNSLVLGVCGDNLGSRELRTSSTVCTNSGPLPCFFLTVSITLSI